MDGGTTRAVVELVVRGDCLLTMDERGTVFTPGAVAVQGNRIVAVGAAEAILAAHAPRRVLGGSDRVVLPGFVNAHTHTELTALRGLAEDQPLHQWLQHTIWPAMRQLDEEAVHASGVVAAAEMIRGGMTACADLSTLVDPTVSALGAAGIRAAVAYNAKDGRDTARTAGEVERALRAWERHHGAAGGRITVMLGIHSNYQCSEDYMRRVASLAEARGIGIHVHLSESRHEVEECRARHGCSPPLLLAGLGALGPRTLAAHGVWLDEADLACLRQHGVAVAHNPAANAKLGNGIAPVAAMLARGIRVGLGTDSVASNNRLDAFDAMKSAALLAKAREGDPCAVTAPQIVAMATREGARALGLGEQVGTLEAGKLADLVVLDGRGEHWQPAHFHRPETVYAHLVYAATASDVETVVIDGVAVCEAGRLTRAGAAQDLRRARHRMHAFLRQAGLA